MESFVVLVQYRSFQFYSVFWNNGETISTRFRRRTSHSKISTNAEPYCKGAVARPTSVSQGKRSYGSLDPWSSLAEKEERSGRFDIGMDRMKASDHYYHEQFMESFSSARYSKWDDDRAWSCQEWKNWYWDARAIGATRWNFLESDTRNSTGFLSRGNPSWWNRAIRCEWSNASWQTGATRCRFSGSNMTSTIRHWKRWSRIGFVSRIKIIRESGEWSIAKKTEKNFKSYRKWRKTFYDLGNVHDCNNGISSIHGKELPEQLAIHCEYNRSHTQANVRHIYKIGVWTKWDLRIGNNWLGESFTERPVIIGDERVINLQCTKVYVYSDSVLCVGTFLENRQSNDPWEQRLGWLKSSSKLEKLWQNRRRAMEFEWNIFTGFTTLQLCSKVTDLLSRLGETPENFTGRILFMSMFKDISCGTKDNEAECLANAKLVSLYAKRFGKGQWSFTGPGSEKKWYSIIEDSPQGIWDKIAEWMLLEFAERGCPIFRATTHCPEIDSEAKDMGNCRYTMQPIWKRLRLFFA